MATKQIVKNRRAIRRRRRVRGKISGTAAIPRLTVAKSLNNVFVQIVDDENSVTLAAAASNTKAVRDQFAEGQTKTDVAKKVGEAIASLAKEKGIVKVVFDRNVSRFHGRVKAVAAGAREGGLVF
jgi:large subunit ribosomal protein L18